MKTKVKVFSLVFLGIILVSCPLLQRDYSTEDPGDDVEIPDDGLGVLEIDFTSGFEGIRDLFPPVLMEIDHYTVAGRHSDGVHEFDADVYTGDSLTQYGLLAGFWTITVNAINPDGVLIGDGSVTAEITAGLTTSVHVTVAPLSGNGTLEVTVQWSKQVFKKGERVDATLSPPVPDGTLIISDPGTQGEYRYCSISSASIQAGYYLMTLQLFVDDVLENTMVVAVRILTGQISSGIITFPL